MRSLLIFLAATLLWGVSANSYSRAPGKPPNVVLILADDLGWSDLGSYGSRNYQTPNLDRLAEQGMRFTQAYSACAVCSPSRAAILTGKHPARLRLTDWIPGQADQPSNPLLAPPWTNHLPTSEITLPEVLGRSGYVSASVGKWHLGKKEQFPEAHGFHVNIAGCGYGTPPSYFWPYRNRRGRLPHLDAGTPDEYLTDRLTTEALTFVAQHRDRPFFLYLSHHAVHVPLQAKPEKIAAHRQRLQGRDVNTTYAAMIESLDESVGSVMRALDELQLTDNTLLVFTSDNGGLWPAATDNSPLRAGKTHAYEGGIRVPLLVRYPGAIRAGSVCHTPVVGTDLFPTFAEFAGVQIGSSLTSAPLDGQSLVPLLRDKPGFQREDLYWHYPHYWHGRTVQPYGIIRSGDWKLIEFYEDMRMELYNLATDLGEKNDLSVSEPKKCEELRKKLHEWRRSVDVQMPIRKSSAIGGHGNH